MRTITMTALASGLILSLAACGQTMERRAATGGIGGATAGAVVGGPVGAVVGGAGGAAAGSMMDRPVDEAVGDWTGGTDGGATAGATGVSGTELSRADVRSLQQALNAEGHSLAVDGIWGPNTRDALIGFQRDRGIDATGRLDRQTVAALQTAGR
ncbi:peptidoglycan-binding domain-containing protein [Azospirillum halopraeferens]|uniref:peptidoglycan-binding domain-containing protein n=1 Tax=Azospirillum halopraeferens TaxID=34010 RepID=UPI000421FFE9|nr:peptidoglycan-binding domain-containing protein [Azospirillum halopraeferens]